MNSYLLVGIVCTLFIYFIIYSCYKKYSNNNVIT